MPKVTKKQLIQYANLQPLEYFEKYLDILCNNLRVTMKRIKFERDRPGYEVTAQVIEQTQMKNEIIGCWLLENVINTKKELLKHD